ncbi:MAG: lysophospholipid acyltransferase family protein [Actinomycetota bacterium]|nr:lysophospholipid acyltransferase family protein [Actinomycetota bacterium]
MRVTRRDPLGWGYRVTVFLLKPLLNLLTKQDWAGTENLTAQTDGMVIATNHISWFDPLVASHALWDNDRPPRFLAKESVFRVPIVGAIITSAKQIRVYRETGNAVDSVRDAIAAVHRGECVVVYPEGTITRDPMMWPMTGKTGAARIALAAGCPLIPMAQWGAQEVMGPYRKEFRILPRKTMKILVGPPIDLSDLQDRPLDADTLHLATDRLLDALTGLLAQIRQESPPKERYVFDRQEH